MNHSRHQSIRAVQPLNLSQSLATLLKGIVTVSPREDCIVSSITQDSREVVKGSLFVALKGLSQHGLKYAEEVQKQGASAILWEADATENDLESYVANLVIPCLAVSNLRSHLGLIADRFYHSPSQSLNVIGITGTDGKTSVSHFLAQSLDDCAVIGTIGTGIPGKLQKATHTTPDVLSVHKTLAELKSQGIRSVAMEVSSHALDQGRVDQVDFDVAVLTNLSRDHLDYHKTVEAYAEAKAKLFDWSGLNKRVINLDDAFGQKLLKKGGDGYLYSITEPESSANRFKSDKRRLSAKITAKNARFSETGISATILLENPSAKKQKNEQGELNVKVLGRFNLSNLLATLATMLALGESLDTALQRINQVQTVEGRMQKVSDSDVLVVVDFAHTPNALETVLKALREHTRKQLICVFGCGGDRDAGKRPLMAAVAEAQADVVITTDDNPRTEDPEKIMQDIMAGFRQPQRVTVEHDRAAAIQIALQQAGKGDVVLIAGKGHEKVQITANGTIPFSDQEQASRVLQEMAA